MIQHSPRQRLVGHERLTNRLYSAHWRGWLTPENRCLVPVNSFAKYAPEPNPETKKKDVVWFALNDDRPLFAFGGLWTTFNGDRGTKSKPIPGLHLVYGFLTTSPNAVVEPIHPKAMPVILTTDEERDVWMRGAVGRGQGTAATVAHDPPAQRSASSASPAESRENHNSTTVFSHSQGQKLP